MAKEIQIPVFMERNGKCCSFIKALSDFELYHSMADQSEEKWRRWRTREMKKYGLNEEE